MSLKKGHDKEKRGGYLNRSISTSRGGGRGYITIALELVFLSDDWLATSPFLLFKLYS